MPGCGRRGRCRKRREWCRGSLPDRNGDGRRAMWPARPPHRPASGRARSPARRSTELPRRGEGQRDRRIEVCAAVRTGDHYLVKTAIAQVTMTTIHPAPLPLVRASETFAQTPVPRSSITAVPMNSARTGVMTSRFYGCRYSSTQCRLRRTASCQRLRRCSMSAGAALGEKAVGFEQGRKFRRSNARIPPRDRRTWLPPAPWIP